MTVTAAPAMATSQAFRATSEAALTVAPSQAQLLCCRQINLIKPGKCSFQSAKHDYTPTMALLEQ